MKGAEQVVGNFVYIFINIVIPVFIQMGIGYGLQKKFNINVNALTKVQMYVFLPSLLFVRIYQSNISKEIFMTIIFYTFALFALLYFISWLISKVKKYPSTVSKAFINATCFYNTGNFCIPLLELLYKDPLAMSINIIIILAQNITSSTIGVFNSSSGRNTKKEALMSVLKMPMLYSIAAALIFKGLNIKVWQPVWSSVSVLGEGLVPLALITLGVQLANTPINFRNATAYLTNFVRLIISPLMAYGLTLVLGLNGLIAQVMIISSASPTAVNTVLMAIEFDNEADFASQAIFSATVFSAITVTTVIFLVTRYV